MLGYRVDPSDEGAEQFWWETRWGPILVGLGLGACTIVADNYGYGGAAEWAIAFACGTGIAIAAFWSRRGASWFWPAVALLIVAHIVALVGHRWRVLPHYPMGTAIQLKGAAGLDFAVSGLFLYLVHRLFDPRTGLKSHWNTTAKVIVSAFTLLFLGIFAFVVAVIVRAHNEKVALSRVVFSQGTHRQMHELLDCLDTYKTENDQWDDVHGRYPGKQLFDDFNGRLTRVLDTGSARVVQISTVRGRPLYPQEQQRLSRCMK